MNVALRVMPQTEARVRTCDGGYFPMEGKMGWSRMQGFGLVQVCGMFPVSLLPAKLTKERPSMSQMLQGTEPWKLFLEKSRYVKAARLEREEGTFPVIELL